METTVFVVSNCWWRDGATVIGVADSVLGAQEIADRYEVGKDDTKFSGWDAWRERDRTLYRDALNGNEVHPSLYQEIVAVRCTLTQHEAVRQANGVGHIPMTMHIEPATPGGTNTSLIREAYARGVQDGQAGR